MRSAGGMVLAAMICLESASMASAQTCGGSFSGFLGGVRQEALARGLSPQAVDRFLSGAAQDSKVLAADRSQGVFRRSFLEFSSALISKNRMQTGAAKARANSATLQRAQRDYGVSPGILLAFWGFETDFGAVQGNFNTRNALLTLAHDCRRPDLFRPQVFAAIELTQQGAFDPARTTGAWAGEIGMVQMLPKDILERGVDGDGDGRVTLKTSPPDAILSGARMLKDLGWRRNEPWLQEVVLPENLDWSLTGIDRTRRGSDWVAMGVRPRSGSISTGLPASVLLPQGRKGPAFLAYPNFNVLFGWNKSFVYVTTAAYFATRLEGAPPYLAGKPDPALSEGQMKQLQQKLAQRGHNVGAIDGILGAQTRVAVQKEQIRLGLPADAWPTAALLSRL